MADGNARARAPRPLSGRRIVVTRPRKQAASLLEALAAQGADVIAAPAIRFEPPTDWQPVDRAIETTGDYDWLLFTSANAVSWFCDRLDELGKQLDSERPRIAAVGPATRRALNERGLHPALTPGKFVAEEVFQALQESEELRGQRFLFPSADIARDTLPELLREAGATLDTVVVYRTVSTTHELDNVRERILSGEIDVVTFTSGSTVQSFCRNCEPARFGDKFLAASIGPVTSEALRGCGLDPAIEASESTAEGLVRAVIAYFERSRSE